MNPGEGVKKQTFEIGCRPKASSFSNCSNSSGLLSNRLMDDIKSYTTIFRRDSLHDTRWGHRSKVLNYNFSKRSNLNSNLKECYQNSDHADLIWKCPLKLSEERGGNAVTDKKFLGSSSPFKNRSSVTRLHWQPVVA